MYIGVKELMEQFPEIKLEEAKTIIKLCRNNMEKDGLYVPNTRKLLALKNYVEKLLGVSFTEHSS